VPSIVVIGAQFGDEGKGKIVDLLGEKAELVVRFNGGNNAGHTVVVKGEKYKFHLMPSGAIQGKHCCIAAGVALDPRVLKEELRHLEGKFSFRLTIDPRTQVIMPWHNALDGANEAAKGSGKIGTTGRGIGPCYADRADRSGIRFCELVEEERLREKIGSVFPLKEKMLKAVYNSDSPLDREAILREYAGLGAELRSHLGDVSAAVCEALEKKKTVLFEGAQGTFLDNDFGTYPFVTSSHPTAGAIFTGVGMPLQKIERVIGVAKAYTTRVGSGPFVTELHGAFADGLREKGAEFGTTTGRPRRVGWLDLVLLRAAHRLNGFTEIALTKIDVLCGMEELNVCVAYECGGKRLKLLPGDTKLIEGCKPVYKKFPGFDFKPGAKKFAQLPREAKEYVSFIEKEIGVPVKIVGVGPGREETITR